MPWGYSCFWILAFLGSTRYVLPVTIHTACILWCTRLKVDLLLEITQEDAYERSDLSTEVLVKGRETLVQATGCI